jgi:hypothetical protein
MYQSELFILCVRGECRQCGLHMQHLTPQMVGGSGPNRSVGRNGSRSHPAFEIKIAILVFAPR